MKNIIILILILLGIDSHINAQDPKEIKVIAIYGDTQDNTAIHQKIAKHILSYHPQLVIHTGDEVNRGNKQKQWTSFNNIISDLMKSALYFPVPGNHENEAKLYYSNFNLPEPRKWYFYQNKNLLFLFINSNL